MSDRAPDKSHPRRKTLTVDDYFAGVRAGNVAVLARALTLVESRNPRHQALAETLITRLLSYSGQSIRVGISGTPGAGKSTFIEALGLHLVRGGKRVAVLAVDPSSSITGGSILGDKTRMAKLSAEPNAYIRPSPSAGTLGGVAGKTRENMLVCEAAGYDAVLIETVGVGQSESMVAQMSDCFLAILLPGAGDDLQGIKRGLLELVDVIAVNKAEGANRAAAESAAQQYRTALHLLSERASEDAPVVLTCSALEHEGIDAVWAAIEQKVSGRQLTGELTRRRQRQELDWLWAVVEEHARRAIHIAPRVMAIKAALEGDVLAGRMPAEVAARQILDAFGLDAHAQLNN
jgi:LAO/AO transport system kinase